MNRLLIISSWSFVSMEPLRKFRTYSMGSNETFMLLQISAASNPDLPSPALQCICTTLPVEIFFTKYSTIFSKSDLFSGIDLSFIGK